MRPALYAAIALGLWACAPLELGSYEFACSAGAECAAGHECVRGRCVDPALEICGDGRVGADEACDDGNAEAGDGCALDCTLEPQAICRGAPSRCTRCGDGVRAGAEACDDGNLQDGDGCNTACAAEPGWSCDALGCKRCGDGVLQLGEACDDGDLDAGDGCDARCTVEPGYRCDTLGCGRCGNGRLERDERCDDGEASGGCRECRVVFGYRCSGARGESSQCARLRFRAVSLGEWNSCGVTAGGELWCTGGGGIAPAEALSINQPPRALPELAALSVGHTHACGIAAEDGQLLCWGDGTRNRSEGAVSTTATVPPSDFGPALGVSAGAAFTCALTAARQARCFGYDMEGESTPTSTATLSSISAGFFHACALRTTGVPLCWGWSDGGRLRPARGYYTQIDAGPSHSCGVGSDSRLHCWGLDSSPPGRTQPPPGATWLEVQCGHTFSCARDRAGSVGCWGAPFEGAGDDFLRPPPGAAKAIFAGGAHACALRDDDTLDCWGYLPSLVDP